MHVYLCVYVCVCIYLHISVGIHVYVYLCIHMCVSVCVCMCVYQCRYFVLEREARKLYSLILPSCFLIKKNNLKCILLTFY